MTWTPLNLQTFALGESPFWHPHEHHLYWVDIEARKVVRANGFTGELQDWTLPTAPGCIAPAAGGGLVLALRDGLYRAVEWRGALTLIQPSPYDTVTTRFNDGKCDVLGRLWAGTMYEPRDKALGVLYAFDARAGGAPTVQALADTVTVANGLAWSPDHKTVYWADTAQHIIRAWDWDAHTNTLSRGRVFHQFPFKPAGWTYGMPGYLGRPDGATVDAQGNYWVAMFEGGRVLKLSPAGVILDDLPTPAFCPTMPCFGGDDLKTLYVTSASYKRSAQELADFPQSGCVFSMRASEPGLPVNFFRDGPLL